MTRTRLPRPRYRPAPGQLSLDALLRAYPDARGYARTRTGWGLAVLEGGLADHPAPVTSAVAQRRAAA